MRDPELGPRRRFAGERSHQDAKFADDFFRATAQATILINGGAATAVLAFAGKNPSPIPNWALAVALSLYAMGASFGVRAIYNAAKEADNWAYYWETIALNSVPRSPEPPDELARAWTKRRINMYWLSIAAFTVATVILAGSIAF